MDICISFGQNGTTIRAVSSGTGGIACGCNDIGSLLLGHFHFSPVSHISLLPIRQQYHYVVEQSLMQRLIPKNVQGQVFGARGALSIAGYPFGGVAGGVLFMGIAAPLVIGISALLCIGMGCLILFALPINHFDRRTSHQRRKATNAHTPSTTPNGQVPASQPYKEEAAQASAKISTHQFERFSKAYEINIMVTAHAPKRVSKLIFHLSSVLYPDDTMLFTTNRLLSGIIRSKKQI